MGPGRYRVIDIAVFAHHEPSEEVRTEVPYVTIEVLSPDDRYSGLLEKLGDFETLGVPHIYLADPFHRRLSRYHAGGLTPVNAIDLSEFNASIPAAEVFR